MSSRALLEQELDPDDCDNAAFISMCREMEEKLPAWNPISDEQELDEPEASQRDEDLDGDLTQKELEWIMATRDAVNAAGLSCSNVLMVQLAIVTKGRTDRALRRLNKLKQWEENPVVASMSREEAYKEANETSMVPEHGYCAAIRRAKNGSIGFACDYASYRPSNLRLPVGILAVVATFEACSSSLADVRRGVTIVCNSKGVGYSNISPTAELAFAEMYVEGYPIRINRFVLVDVTVVARLLLRVLRKVLPRKLNQRFHLISSEELSNYYDRDALPSFLKGTNPPSSKEWWGQLRARREAWEAELLSKYGPGFEKL
ncbi:hypothetical protein AB1Y20_000989 [Prymnesium parvum]|uniref:CRAL-TRIO domain-containing protein n=1 Tax=Prymnesium parvum TaxID=97485 RepID=A0AB34K9S4_PRYPA